MQRDDARAFVLSLYRNLLKRAPADEEFAYWVRFMEEGSTAEKVYYSFISCAEYRMKSNVSTPFAPGHYHSAIVDPSTVREYVHRERQAKIETIGGIPIPLGEMEEFWRRFSGLIRATPFQHTKNELHRYYYGNNNFSYGDAIGLRAVLADLRPQRVVEIGSGFSSVCMLDCADEFGLGTEFTFIDPNPERLNGLLRTQDFQRIRIIGSPVQETDLSLYKELGRRDVLFIDSTHVLKTGSDVHYELFHILPCLQRGVIVHFHDVQFPFEYPDGWIFQDNYSWNEIYALRAFLMYNSSFRVRFWGSCLAHERENLIREVFPPFLKNAGGSLWIERM